MFHVEQLPCWITYTNPSTHDIIRANLDQSPMYAGIIEGVGPRYCPSIEDKVVRFAEQGAPPGVPRARGSAHQRVLRQRRLDLAAVRGPV